MARLPRQVRLHSPKYLDIHIISLISSHNIYISNVIDEASMRLEDQGLRGASE